MVGATCVPLVNTKPEKPPQRCQNSKSRPREEPYRYRAKCCEGSEKLSRDEDFAVPEVTGHFVEDPSLDLWGPSLTNE